MRPDPRRQHLLRPRTCQRSCSAGGRRRRARRSSPTGCATPSATASSSSTRRAGSISLEEKPRAARSRHYAVTGLYFYDNQVLEIAARLKPSRARRARDHRRQPRVPRAGRRSNVEVLGRGIAWLDTGTHESLLQAANFVADHRAAPGTQDRLPRGDRLPPGLHRRGASRARSAGHREEQLRPVPAGFGSRTRARRRPRDRLACPLKTASPLADRSRPRFAFDVVAGHGANGMAGSMHPAFAERGTKPVGPKRPT